MFHAPTSDSKQQSDSTKADPPAREQDWQPAFDASYTLGLPPVTGGGWQPADGPFVIGLPQIGGRGLRPPKPVSPRQQKFMRLQRAYGNQAVLRMLELERSQPAIQPKLVINEPGDAYEQEADRVADQVMRMPAPELSIAAAPPQLSRKCAACEEEKQKAEPAAQSIEGGDEEYPPVTQTVVFRKAAFAAPRATARSAASVADRLLECQGGGEPLQVKTRQRMEDTFGYDFSRVRVHHDAEAGSMSKQVGALAFTHGNHIFFGDGMFDPGGSSGARLLAHELTHVVQQGRARPRGQSDAFGPVAAGQGIAVMSDRGSDQTIQRIALWVGGPVNEVNNTANSFLNGAPAGVTLPVLNATTFVGAAAARPLLLPPTLAFAAAATGGVNATVTDVDINTGGFDETVLAPGPWSIVAPKAVVGARFGSLAACSGPGNSTFQADGIPNDAAMFAANRGHEDQHAAEDKIAFNASVGAWDAKLTAARDANTVFPGPTNADAEAALFTAMGGTLDQIADAYWNKVSAAGAAFHATPKGGTVKVSNPTSNADCSTSAAAFTNPWTP